MNLVISRTNDEQTGILAQYLRGDQLHESKNINGSILQKVLSGLAVEFLRQRDKLNEVYSEYDPNNTTKFIEEWEDLVGIPDECLTNTGTLEQRRQNILLKLAGANASTEQQFKDVATVLGFDVQITNAIDIATFPLTLPFILVNQSEAPFIIVITLQESVNANILPLTLPFELASDKSEILKCFFEKLKPSQCSIYYRYI